jgi:hypothetical protein
MVLSPNKKARLLDRALFYVWLPGTDSNPAEDGISAWASTQADQVVNPAESGTLPAELPPDNG